MLSEEFLINDLARQAGVTPRTIRYYTDEGLLPLPQVRGKYAYYTAEHLNRLRLILRMKDTYLPLREIRLAINALTDQEVADQLQNPEPSASTPDPTPDQPAPGAGARALDYIARLRDRQTELRSTYQAAPAPAALPPAPTAGDPAAGKVAFSIAMPEAPVAEAAQVAEIAPQTWQRISLAPGVELQLRSPASLQDQAAIQQLLAFARQLFTHSPKEL